MKHKRYLILVALTAVLLFLAWALLLYPGSQLTDRRLLALNELLDGAVVTEEGHFPYQGFVVLSPQGCQAIQQDPQLQWRLLSVLEQERIVIVLDVWCEDFFSLIPGAELPPSDQSEESRRFIRAVGITSRGEELLLKEEFISRRYSVSRLAAALIDFAISIEEAAQQSDTGN